MIKHKHYDMIVAKAANMDLVLFVKCGKNDKWKEPETPVCFPLSEFEDVDYFLCLPQHKEACLHWLNGGVVQVEYTKASYPYWTNIDCDEVNWSDGHIFMDDSVKIRIKPNKVKRWIGVHAKSGLVTQGYCDTEKEIEGHVLRGACSPKAKFCDWQFIEIEVEE